MKNIFKDLFKKNEFTHVSIVEGSPTTSSDKKTILLFTKNGKYTWAKFKCPCGCGRDITLSLNNSIKPSWDVHLVPKKNTYIATFSPSIWLTGDGCKSHFFIRENHVEWARPMRQFQKK